MKRLASPMIPNIVSTPFSTRALAIASWTFMLQLRPFSPARPYVPAHAGGELARPSACARGGRCPTRQRAVDEARVQLVDGPDTEQPQRPHELLVQEPEHPRDAGLAAEREPVDGHPPD